MLSFNKAPISTSKRSSTATIVSKSLLNTANSRHLPEKVRGLTLSFTKLGLSPETDPTDEFVTAAGFETFATSNLYFDQLL